MKKDLFEELIVVKRSGQRVNFNSYKIAIAIKSAFDNVYLNYDEKNVYRVYEDVVKHIEENYVGRKTINVEDIQDIIENKLKEFKFNDVYVAYNLYRQKRALSRKAFTQKAQHKFVKAMEKIANDNSIKGDHALKPNEILLNYGRTVTNEFMRSYFLDNKYLRAHEEGYIFMNDFEDFPLGKIRSFHPMLDQYLNTNNSINGLTNEILNLENEISNEVNISALDYLMTEWLTLQYKYYYKEYIANYLKIMGFNEYLNLKKIFELIDRESIIKDKTHDFQQFIRTNQVRNIFKSAYEDCISKITEIVTWKINKLINSLEIQAKNKISISFGTNESHAGSIINHAILDVLESSVTLNNLTLIFKVKPKVYENYIERINDLIIKGQSIALSFIQNSYNKDSEEIEYFASGIRIFEDINDSKRKTKGRMLVAETAINMSRLGLKYAGRPIKNFYNELDEVLELVKNQLLMAFETLGNKSKENY